jgi:hypothetical protein
MAVSFLDLTPKPPTDVVTIDTGQGPQDIELSGLTLRVLGDIGKRFPGFRAVIEGGAGSILDDPEALGALVAAALGHPGDQAHERHLAGFPSGDVMAMALVAIKLTFPREAAAPLSGGVVNGAGAAAPDPTSPLPLSS